MQLSKLQGAIHHIIGLIVASYYCNNIIDGVIFGNLSLQYTAKTLYHISSSYILATGRNHTWPISHKIPIYNIIIGVYKPLIMAKTSFSNSKTFTYVLWFQSGSLSCITIKFIIFTQPQERMSMDEITMS